MGNIRDLNWMHKFEQMQIFQEIFGHNIIPQRYNRNPSLGSWVTKQRFFSKRMAITLGRRILLKKINFPFFSCGNFYFFSLWNKRYLEICYYKKIFGNCNVPSNFRDNLSLGFWVKNQRYLFKKKRLETYKINLLCQVGFEWKRKNQISRISWFERYRELFRYFKTNGNINVPQRKGSLGKWIQTQRDFLKKGIFETKKSTLLILIKILGKSTPNKQ